MKVIQTLLAAALLAVITAPIQAQEIKAAPTPAPTPATAKADVPDRGFKTEAVAKQKPATPTPSNEKAQEKSLWNGFLPLPTLIIRDF